MQKITTLAPAKLNLYLNVGEKREDGYHNIETVMQTVTLFDRVDATRHESEEDNIIDVRCRDFTAPDGKDNIVFRAAAAFFAANGIERYHVSFLLDKKIPAGTGLGGGSSDAAASLLALDALYETGMTTEALCALGATVGADVPFCVKKGTCLATGIGEILESVTPMPDCVILIAVPKEQRICTAEAYGKIDAIHATPNFSTFDMLSALQECDTGKIAAVLYNKFEDVVPMESGVKALIDKLTECGAVGARMSGSGPAVFGLFCDMQSARAAKECLGEDIISFICEPARRNYPYTES